MEWICSNGGPLVLVPERYVRLWGGCVSSYTMLYFIPHNEDDFLDDYARACKIDNYVGAIQVADGEGIVFADEVLQSTWVKFPHLGCGGVVRWMYADSEESLRSALQDVQADQCITPAFIFNNPSSKVVLFDSAITGTRVGDNALAIELNPGAYRIETVIHQRDERTASLVHLFLPVS